MMLTADRDSSLHHRGRVRGRSVVMVMVTGYLLVPHRVQTQELPHRSHRLDHAVTLRMFLWARDRNSLGAVRNKGCSAVEVDGCSEVGLCVCLCVCVTCISSSARCHRDLRLNRPTDEASDRNKIETKKKTEGEGQKKTRKA